MPAYVIECPECNCANLKETGNYSGEYECLKCGMKFTLLYKW